MGTEGGRVCGGNIGGNSLSRFADHTSPSTPLPPPPAPAFPPARYSDHPEPNRAGRARPSVRAGTPCVCQVQPSPGRAGQGAFPLSASRTGPAALPGRRAEGEGRGREGTDQLTRHGLKILENWCGVPRRRERETLPHLSLSFSLAAS